MYSRFLLLGALMVSCAGCSVVSGDEPSVVGQDALGHQIFTLGGDRLAALEAKANSECHGSTRPYVHSIAGSGDNVSLTYTCE